MLVNMNKSFEFPGLETAALFCQKKVAIIALRDEPGGTNFRLTFRFDHTVIHGAIEKGSNEQGLTKKMFLELSGVSRERFITLASQIDAESVFPLVEAEFFVEGDHFRVTVENHFVTASVSTDLKYVPNQSAADSVFLKCGMNGHVFDVSDDSAFVNELRFDKQRSGSRNSIVNQSHISLNPSLHSVSKDQNRLFIG